MGKGKDRYRYQLPDVINIWLRLNNIATREKYRGFQCYSILLT